MYCKNCGTQMADVAAVCTNCGVAKGAGTAFCHNCGKELAPGAAVCLACGVAAVPQVQKSEKNKIVAALLAFFLGGLGIHNFYLGYKGKAIAQLLLSLIGWILVIGPAVAGVWAFVEFIMILLDKIPDADGNPLS